MNIIELIQSILYDFPKIKQLHVDYNDDAPDEVFQSFNDYDRLINSGTLLELQMWLERKAENQEVEITVDNKTITGSLTKITCANGMLYNIPDANMNSGVQYQLQITAEYKIESEEF